MYIHTISLHTEPAFGSGSQKNLDSSPWVLCILFNSELGCFSLLKFFPFRSCLLLECVLGLNLCRGMLSSWSALKLEWDCNKSCWKITSSTSSSLRSSWTWWLLSLLSSLFLPRRVTVAVGGELVADNLWWKNLFWEAAEPEK